MALYPLITASVLLLSLAIVHSWQARRRLRLAGSYRGRWLEALHRLEALTNAANALSLQATRVKDATSLDYFESSLRILETLLRVMRDLPPFGDNMSVMKSALFLIKDSEERLQRVREGFARVLRGDAPTPESFHGDEPAPLADGCFFCSRPFDKATFAMTRTKLDNKSRDVMACEYCREELRTTKKIKVLHFQKDGKTLHWSQMPGYRPSRDFWNLNERKTLAPRKLEIVHWRGNKDTPDPKNEE